MAKIQNDEYYTPLDVAKYCIYKTYETIGLLNIKDVIEPSAGTGSFSKQLKNCVAYDINPKDDSILKQDFLQLNLDYKAGRLIIGNPPFGSRSLLARKFLIKSAKIADYISFILPISFANKDDIYFKPCRYGFNLVYTEILDVVYSDVKVKTALCIYKRVPKDELYIPNEYKLKGITIYEWRNNFNYKDCDFGIGSWWCGSMCKEVFDLNTFSKSTWFKIDNKELVPKVKQLLTDKEKTVSFLNKYCVSIPSLSKSRCRRYIWENIKELRAD